MARAFSAVVLVVAVAVAVAIAFIGSRIVERDSSSVSPTAFYTGHVWVRNGMSDERLDTIEGHILYNILEPFMILSKMFGGPTIEETLLARHLVINTQLEKLIDAGLVTQVVEVAAGLSPRGLHFSQRYGSKLTYVEADLPKMVERKRQLIFDSLGEDAPNSHLHRIVVVDALKTSGPGSLVEVMDTLSDREGVVLITEGLMSYFDPDSLQLAWKNFASALKRFPRSYYLANFYLNSAEVSQRTSIKTFMAMLSSFVRGKVYLHFSSTTEVVSALQRAGFADAQVKIPRDWLGCVDESEGSAAGDERKSQVSKAVVCSGGGDVVNILMATSDTKD